MKRSLGILLVSLVVLVSSTAAAQEVTATAEVSDSGFLSNLRIGVHLDLGMANTVGDLDRLLNSPLALEEEATPRFAMGFGVSGQYFLTPIFALEVGLGFVGKGFQVQPGSNFVCTQKWTYLEIPLGVLLELKGFQVGAALALNIALSGRTKAQIRNTTTEEKWNSNEWDHYMRFNLAPKFMVGYAIPIELVFGTLYLIPGMDFSIHLIDEHQGNDLAYWAAAAPDKDVSYRSWNLMFRLGAALSF